MFKCLTPVLLLADLLFVGIPFLFSGFVHVLWFICSCGAVLNLSRLSINAFLSWSGVTGTGI